MVSSVFVRFSCQDRPAYFSNMYKKNFHRQPNCESFMTKPNAQPSYKFAYGRKIHFLALRQVCISSQKESEGTRRSRSHGGSDLGAWLERSRVRTSPEQVLGRQQETSASAFRITSISASNTTRRSASVCVTDARRRTEESCRARTSSR